MAVQHMSHLKNALLGLALIGAVIGLFGLFQIFGDDADVAEAKAAVVKRLKDPDSALISSKPAAVILSAARSTPKTALAATPGRSRSRILSSRNTCRRKAK